jgi:hypothetical protein
MLASLRTAADRSLNLLHRIRWTGPLLVRLTLVIALATT